MTLQDKLIIIQNQFHLKVKEIEPLVYEVINTEQEVNVDKLKQTLEECILITSDQINIDDEHSLIAHVYYIMVDYNRDDLKYKYHKQANLKYKDAVIDSYSKSKEESSYTSIYTIYRLEELVWIISNHILRRKKIEQFIHKDYKRNNHYLLFGRDLPVTSAFSELAEPFIQGSSISIEYLFEE